MKERLERLTKEKNRALEEEFNEYIKRFGKYERTRIDLSLELYISDFVKDWDKLTIEDIIDSIR